LISWVRDSITATTSFFCRPVVSEMLRMISVFVMGLLPDFFAIADSSKNGKESCLRQDPHRDGKNSARKAEREAD
jgi:hypothetical protein